MHATRRGSRTFVPTRCALFRRRVEQERESCGTAPLVLVVQGRPALDHTRHAFLAVSQSDTSVPQQLRSLDDDVVRALVGASAHKFGPRLHPRREGERAAVQHVFAPLPRDKRVEMRLRHRRDDDGRR